MSQRFLLPCSCGRTIPVGISQAGANVTCDCGQSVAVPTIRGLKALQPVKEDSPPLKTQKQSEFNGVNLHGAMFVVGLFLLFGGIALGGYYGNHYRQIDTKDYGVEEREYFDGEIDKLGAAQLLTTWEYLQHVGIGEYEPPDHLVRRQAAAKAFRLTMAGVVLGVSGLALTSYSVLGGSSVRRRT